MNVPQGAPERQEMAPAASDTRAATQPGYGGAGQRGPSGPGAAWAPALRGGAGGRWGSLGMLKDAATVEHPSLQWPFKPD